MEQQVQEELRELCRSILKDERSDISSQLTHVQMLYEKLLVISYLMEKGKSAKPADTENDMDNAKYSEAAVQSNEGEDIDQEDFINESPVIDAELKDDKTPEEQGPLLSAINAMQAGEKKYERKASINDRLRQGNMKVGLNDRIAFVKHLFQGNQEDYNRVLSQINSFEDFEEAENFLEQIVKPDYDWSQKEEYEDRFMQLMRNRFGVMD